MSAVVVVRRPSAADRGGRGEPGRIRPEAGSPAPARPPFRDDTGRDLRLGELFGRRPVILAPVYFRCPLLCNQLLNGLTRSLKPVSLAAGKDFDVIAFSINPAETPELAGPKKQAYLEQYDRPGSENGWHFLVGDQPAITALTEAIGFRYTFNPQTELYAHAAGVVIVTPEGKIARYFYGIDFPPKELENELGRGPRRPHRQPDRPVAATLLRLRRRDRQVHTLDHATAADRGNGDRGRTWGRSCASCSVARQKSDARRYQGMSPVGRQTQLDHRSVPLR